MTILVVAPTDSSAQYYRYSRVGGGAWGTGESSSLYQGELETDDGSYVKLEKLFTGGHYGELSAESWNPRGGLHKAKAYSGADGEMACVFAWAYTENNDYFFPVCSDPDRCAPNGIAKACFALSGDVKTMTGSGTVRIRFYHDKDDFGNVIEYDKIVTSNQHVSWVGCGQYPYSIGQEVWFSEALMLDTASLSETCFTDITVNGSAEGNFMATLRMTSLELSPGHYIAYTGSGDTYPPKVDPPTPDVTQGTIGTQVTMAGPGFGYKKGKVLVGGAATKIISWSDSSVTYEIKNSLPLGPHNVMVQRKDPKGAEPLTYEGAFIMVAPEIASVEPVSGLPDDKVVISGNYFGTKKGKLYIEDPATGKKKNCKVISWDMESITFAVPKLPKGLNTGVAYPLKLTNKAKETAETTFTVLELEP